MAVKMISFNSREDWLENRKKYIGGSDAAAIVGMNPWKTNVQLWQEKTGQVIPEDISSKPYVQFGIAAEPIIRELFKINYPHYEVEYVENSWTNSKYPWAAVSHDGWITEKETGRKGIWECKTTEIVSSMSKEKWAGDKIPDNYYCQILHSFLVREDCEFAHLTALLTFKFAEKEIYQQIKNYHIERSEVKADIEYLMKEEQRFWKQIQEGRKPDLLLPEI